MEKWRLQAPPRYAAFPIRAVTNFQRWLRSLRADKHSPAKFEGKPTDTAPSKPAGCAYPVAPAYRRPPIDVLRLTVPIVFYTQTVPGLGAHARSSPGAWGTAPSGRRERGKNTARRPKNGRPTGLSKSCTRPFNAPQARGRARSRPRPSPRLLGGRGIF
jgi:hypothetical protein